MMKFRFNRALARRGVGYDKQGLIYFRLANIKKEPEDFERLVRQLCTDAAGEEAPALWRFLTDTAINHVYIYNEYRIPPRTLFAWKREVYCSIAATLNEGK